MPRLPRLLLLTTVVAAHGLAHGAPGGSAPEGPAGNWLYCPTSATPEDPMLLLALEQQGNQLRGKLTSVGHGNGSTPHVFAATLQSTHATIEDFQRSDAASARHFGAGDVLRQDGDRLSWYGKRRVVLFVRAGKEQCRGR